MSVIDTEIYVDADSCPVKEETYRVAKRYGLRVVLVAAGWLRTPSEPWIELVVIKDGGQLDSADDRIVERAGPGDIVITEDILLAARCLNNEAKVISPRGRAFTPDSIGEAVATRQLMADLREMQQVSGGPPPFDKRDRSAFLQTLDQTVHDVRQGR